MQPPVPTKASDAGNQEASPEAFGVSAGRGIRVGVAMRRFVEVSGKAPRQEAEGPPKKRSKGAELDAGREALLALIGARWWRRWTDGAVAERLRTITDSELDAALGEVRESLQSIACAFGAYAGELRGRLLAEQAAVLERKWVLSGEVARRRDVMIAAKNERRAKAARFERPKGEQ